jgi:PASTA domain
VPGRKAVPARRVPANTRSGVCTMRNRAVGAAVLLAACFGLPVGPAAAAPDPDTPQLTVAPAETVAGTTVVAHGSCPQEPDSPVELRRPAAEPSDSGPPMVYPSGAVVSVDRLSFAQDVNLVEGEFEEGVGIVVPPGTEPGQFTVTTDCKGSASFEVLDSPALDVTPDDAVTGQAVLATGTCPGPIGQVRVLLDGEDVTVVDQQSDGRLGQVEVPLPDDASSGTHTVTTSCGGSDTVEVSIPVESPDEPVDPDGPHGPVDPAAQVPVPNLEGLTAAQAATVLQATGLLLAGPGTGRGTVSDQDPDAGALVEVGTSVAIELAVEDDSSLPLLPAAGGGGLLLLVLLGAPLSMHRRRLGRERRWLERGVDVRSHGPTSRRGPGPPRAAPGLDILIEARHQRWPPQQQQQQQGGPVQ